MQLPRPLYPGKLLKRYKRFLADVQLESGENITAHCPNPGRMIGLNDPGSNVWLSLSRNPKRKFPYTLELMEVTGGLVGINTGIPNSIVADAILDKKISELTGYNSLRREVKYGGKSRIDILLTDVGGNRCWVEVKNVHLRRDKNNGPGIAEFPDSVTDRGTRHINELANQVAQGDRSVLIFLVQRMDCGYFKIAKDIDPKYYHTFVKGLEAGIEVLCFDTDICLESITIRNKLEVLLG